MSNKTYLKKRCFNFINSFWTLGVLSLILGLLFHFMSLYYKGSFCSNYEKKLLDKHICNILSNMDSLANYCKDKPKNYNFFDESFQSTIKSKNINCFVYQNDSLIAWTDNEYTISNPIGKTFVEKTKNCFVLVKDYSFHDYTFRLSFPLMTNYSIENQYLKNELNPLLTISKELKIGLTQGYGVDYYTPDHKFLFSAKWKQSNQPSINIYCLLFGLYIIALILFLLFMMSFSVKYIADKYYKFLLRCLCLLFSLFLLQLNGFSNILHDSEIFSEGVFASSNIFNSLGNFFIYSILSLFAFSSIIEFINDFSFKFKNKYLYNCFYSLFLIALSLLLIALKDLVSDIIFNSTISFNISQISNINYLSVIGLIALGIWFFIFFFSFTLFINFFIKNQSEYKLPWLGYFIFLIFASLWVAFFNSIDFSALLFLGFITLINIIFRKWNLLNSTSLNILYLLLFSILVSFWLNNYTTENEYNKRKSIIQTLALNQDPQVEYMFSEISKEVYKDTTLLNFFQNKNIAYDSISAYIENKYFKSHSHFDKYDFLITVCTPNLKLNIRPQNVEIICDTFFYHNLIQYGTLTKNKNLYLLEYGTGQINYLGLFRFYNKLYKPYTVYVEINSKIKRKGFTRLLTQKEYDPFEKISGYSLATYENGKRIETYGTYAYPEHLSFAIDTTKDMSFVEKNGFGHLIYKQDKKKVYILSKESVTYLNKLSPFSYLFIFYGLLFFILGSFIRSHFFEYKFQLSFAGRLQITLIPIILISFAVISLITVYYVEKLNEDKNKNQLESLAVAIQTEFEHKLSTDNDLKAIDKDYINSLLTKFSHVFDVDINLFGINGNLLSTSRPEIFDYPLVSKLMNPSAFNYLKQDYQTFYIAKENIGNLVYWSAYIPFHNNEGEVVAFINLPYFAREEFLKIELSNLLMTLMNVYTLIIVLSILVILLVSNHLSRPLILLRNRLQNISINKENKKIDWKGIDEIKTLVDEYNKMIDALAKSSEKLAKNEREFAWREMARQIAHEIKNPLTPMKLSVQYLMKTFHEKDTDESWEKRLQSLSTTLIEQIDALADIASSFSDFANISKSTKTIQEINTLIETVLELYSNNEKIKITFTSDEKFFVFIDKNQWIRVFNNLIKNSIQANCLEITIKLIHSDDNLKIIFSDNGIGIPEEMKDFIFIPKFTTKTKGTGLGLAIIKTIIENSEGTIHFRSKTNEGTTFFIEIPLKENL